MLLLFGMKHAPSLDKYAESTQAYVREHISNFWRFPVHEDTKGNKEVGHVALRNTRARRFIDLADDLVDHLFPEGSQEQTQWKSCLNNFRI